MLAPERLAGWWRACGDGQQSPVLVVTQNETPVLIDGYRRVLALERRDTVKG